MEIILSWIAFCFLLLIFLISWRFFLLIVTLPISLMLHKTLNGYPFLIWYVAAVVWMYYALNTNKA